MSGTFPATPVPSQVTVTSESKTLRDTSHSGKRNVRKLGGHTWRIACTWPDTLSQADFMPILAFQLKQDGRYGTFQYVPPDTATPRGTASGSPVVAGAGQLGTTLDTSGWSASQTVLKQGDVFKLAGYSKVYRIVTDAVSDGAGLATLEFFPALMQSPAAGEALTVTNVPYTVEFASDTLSYTVSGPLLYNNFVELVEVL